MLTGNWVFLGDSLTEGVGSERVSHVSELVANLRAADRANGHHGVNQLRLRRVNPNGFDRFIRFNVAGYMNLETADDSASLWVWNLAAEGQTIANDFEWLPLLTAIRPELVVIFRGSLESIIRPSMVRDGSWPWWVPNAWRGYAAMDPRCYFSSTWWRKSKQVAIDGIKLRVRRRLLQTNPGRPLMDLDELAENYRELIGRLQKLKTRVLVLGLLPLANDCFPDSPEYFRRVNNRIRDIALAGGAEFYDWGTSLPQNGDYRKLFYRDSFHPNAEGAKTLAAILQQHL